MDRDIDLPLLRTFLMVATTGSFSDAGQRLLRTQPAISQRIQKLEDIIGVRLLDRAQDGVRPTREGEVAFGYAKLILELHNELQARVRQFAETKYIRIGISEESHIFGIGSLLRQLKDTFPTVSTFIDIRLDSELIDGITSGFYDIVIRISLSPILGSRDFVFMSPLMWVSSTSKSFSANDTLPLLLLSGGSVYRQEILSTLAVAGMKCAIVCESPSGQVIQEALHAGIGLSVLPKWSVRDGLKVYDEKEGYPCLPNVYISLVKHAQCELCPVTNQIVRVLEGFVGNFARQGAKDKPPHCG